MTDTARRPIASIAQVTGLAAAIANPDTGNFFATDSIGGQLQELGRFGQVLADTTLLSTVALGTWTADASTDTITCSVDHGYIVNDAIAFAAGTGALPAGLAAEPEYYWVVSVPTTKTMTISATYGGAALDITSAGTAGWQVKTLPTVTTAAPHTYSGFSLRELKSLDLYWSCSWARKGASGYTALVLNGASSPAAYTSSTGATPGLRYISLNGAAFVKKYTRAVARVQLRLIDNDTASVMVTSYGISSGVANYASDTAGIGQTAGGQILIPGDLTSIGFADALGGKVLSGARLVAVRGSWL